MDKRTIYLFERYAARSLTQEETEELKKFIGSSKTNRRIFLDFSKLLKTKIQSDMLWQLDTDEGWRNIQQKINVRKRNRRFRKIAVAASVALLVGIGIGVSRLNSDRAGYSPELEAMMMAQAKNRAIVTMPNVSSIRLDSKERVRYTDAKGNVICENMNGNLTYYTNSNTPLYSTVTVEEGSTYKITLADGTAVTLASGSELVYPVGGGSRDVRLKGTAYFDVKKDAGREFTVDCRDNIRITVKGTKFNVSAPVEGPVTVTLESGSISLATKTEDILMAPDQQASVDLAGNISVAVVDPKLYTQWASEIYEFDNVTLDVITSQLSLWYGIKFRFASDDLSARKFTGVLLRNKNLSYSLDLLKNVSNLNFRTDGECIIIE